MNKRSPFTFFTLYTFFTLFTFSYTHAQDSSRIRISLLTCTPGDELYSIFGHSALRIIDSNSVTDIVYNYGTFSFDDPDFYIKFIRGKLPYYISIARFEEFKFEYQTTNRGMTEQILNFSAEEKITIRHRLVENLKDENKYYQYDFFLDNCTTRLRDIIVKNKKPTPQLPAVMPVTTTFRNAIHKYLDAGLQPWSKLGIDILLGAPTDAVMTPSQQQFLPDNLMIALDSSNNTTVVDSSSNLYPYEPVHEKHWFTPMMFSCSLLALYILLSLLKSAAAKNILNGLDGLLFFITGLLGLLLIFMMTATDHSMTKNNYNIFWAWPTHIFAAFLLFKKNLFVKYYFLVTAVALALLLLLWFFLPQQMNNALIPVVLLLIFRCASRYLKI
ncbi:MAG: DUF4105 domain-containing protein [Ferruginibacter sp.]